MSLLVAFEGDTDVPIVRKLAADAGFEIKAEIDCRGKGPLMKRLSGYNAAAIGSPWFVLRDLDADAPCAAALVSALEASRWMCLRVAVREVEAWVLADAEGTARWLEIDVRRVPTSPDRLVDPTGEIVRLAALSRNAQVRKALVPRPGSGVRVGPRYEAALIAFGERGWSLRRAVEHSDSLRRARAALRRMGSEWRRFLRGQ